MGSKQEFWEGTMGHRGVLRKMKKTAREGKLARGNLTWKTS